MNKNHHVLKNNINVLLKRINLYNIPTGIKSILPLKDIIIYLMQYLKE